MIEGTEYLDGVRGPVVFVANHSSHLDTPLILGSLPERFADRVAVGAASDYFFDVRWRATLTAIFFNAFPVERYGSRRLRSLALDLVDDGWSLLLYPEGTRSEDGWINPFKLGAAMPVRHQGHPVRADRAAGLVRRDAAGTQLAAARQAARQPSATAARSSRRRARTSAPSAFGWPRRSASSPPRRTSAGTAPCAPRRMTPWRSRAAPARFARGR